MTASYPQAAFAWCRAVTRAHSRTFYWGSLLYPPGQREAMWAIYAACRAGDEIADGAKEQGKALQSWWQEVQLSFAGEARTPMQAALAWTAAHYSVPLSAFAELHAGFTMDVTGARYQTLEDLRLYCRRVAGVVGLMVAPISGYRDERALMAALKLGEAMQLTNILRDVGEDLRLGRLYLPETLLGEYGVSVSELRLGRVSPKYRALLQFLEAQAREGYAVGLSAAPLLRGRARYAVAVAAEVYQGILDELRLNGYDNLSRRATVGTPRRLYLTARALLRQCGAPILAQR